MKHGKKKEKTNEEENARVNFIDNLLLMDLNIRSE